MFNQMLVFLFKGYARKVRKQAEDEFNLKLEAYKASLDIKDLIRERFQSVRIGHPNDDSLVITHLASLDDASRIAFLSKAYDVIEKNETFKMVLNSLLIDSQKQASLYSEDMVNVNFNRASVNGMMLIEEELSNLAGMYIREKEDNKQMSTEEKLAPL